MRTAAIGSNSAEKTVWWKVDLGRIFNIYDINILFKTYDGYGVKPYDMFIVYFTRVIDSAIPTFSLNCKNVKSQAPFFIIILLGLNGFEKHDRLKFARCFSQFHTDNTSLHVIINLHNVIISYTITYS